MLKTCSFRIAPFSGTVSRWQWLQPAILLVVLVTALAHCRLAGVHLDVTRAEIDALYGPAMTGFNNSPGPRFSYDDLGMMEEVHLDAYRGSRHRCWLFDMISLNLRA